MLRTFLIFMLAAAAHAEFAEISTNLMDTTCLTQLGREVLQMPGIKWQHAQTERFVYHFERRTFAIKVSRMAEFMFSHIASESKASPDVPGRSHIFIFRSEKDWRQFIRVSGMLEEWAFSIVRGPEMYLQQADGTSESGGVLAHEMTHLVLNRLFTGHIPLWLNEGMAEWYGEFGYAAFKGIKKSRRQPFKKSSPVYPLNALFAAKAYPQDVNAFYFASKMLVGYLLLDQPPEKFMPFVRDLIGDMPEAQAFQKHYGFESPGQLQKKLEAFLN